jgi:hypothetical protein
MPAAAATAGDGRPARLLPASNAAYSVAAVPNTKVIWLER